MAPKRRRSDRAHYPEFLLKVKHRGQVRFRFKVIDGSLKMFPPGTTEQQAIQAALAYNEKYRANAAHFSLESSNKRNTRPQDPFNKPLAEWLPIVIKRVSSEEGLSQGVLSKFKSECEKLNEALGNVHSKDLSLADINKFLNDNYSNSSKRTFNGKVSNLKKVFSYLADESAIESNFMVNKKLRKVSKEDFKKSRRDLLPSDYEAIYEAAPLYLKVAMALSLQTTHVVREIYRIKYKINAPKEGVCGVVWNQDQAPHHVDGHEVYGTLYIHREKVKKSDSSLVAIPVTAAIKEIIDLSKTDRLHCPYVVHRKPVQSTRGVAKDCDHPYQVHHQNISKEFSRVRDSLGLYSDVDKKFRPTYHEIRGLSARLIEQMGESATIRMAHANEKTTKIYTGSDKPIWNEATPITVSTN
ncbi:integrase [Vibrio sp. Isolate24]|uniref:integrase n=1 Tax=Vibrio sp. Isolate24 TaxID=2908534 RepID=UPI001EFD24B5|nr:integrase [Vibrio sp. Isolate24]MCG9678714.1 integrase [Vibrio sp. Isolate24]